MSYSVPVKQRMSLAELKKHIHTLPDQPDLIPYRTSYYAENWAFCMPHRQFEALRDEAYEVFIDSSLEDGHLTYGEYLHKGDTEDEFLLSAHVCHPSLANDNCSGHRAADASRQTSLRACVPAIATASCLLPAPSAPSPGSPVTRSAYTRIKHGLVVSMVGDSGGPTFKKSRRGSAEIDRAMVHVADAFRPVAGGRGLLALRL